MSTPITTFDGLDDGTSLAVVFNGGRVERWEWRDQMMQKDKVRLPPFFFSGLLSEQKIMPGNFTPPVSGEWFASRGNSDWSYLVLSERTERIYRCAYHRRGTFYDFREAALADLLDNCERIEAPDWSSPQYVVMAVRCEQANQALVLTERQTRAFRSARNNVTYARDYLVRALEQMEVPTT